MTLTETMALGLQFALFLGAHATVVADAVVAVDAVDAVDAVAASAAVTTVATMHRPDSRRI